MYNLNNRKNKTISVRCSEKEKEEITKRSKDAGMTPSSYILKSTLMGCEKFERNIRKREKSKKICLIHNLLNEFPDSDIIRKLHKEIDELWDI